MAESFVDLSDEKSKAGGVYLKMSKSSFLHNIFYCRRLLLLWCICEMLTPVRTSVDLRNK